MDSKKADLEKYKQCIRRCEDCVFLNRQQGYGIARGCSPLKDWGSRLAGAKPLGRLGGPSGQGKALWKTANRIGWAPYLP